MLDGTKLPSKGSAVRLDRGHLAVAGTVIWEAGNVRGIRFDGNINVDEWVERIGHSGQRRVDRAIEAMRRGGPVQDQIDENSRRSLKELRDELGQICEQMATLPNFSVELGEKLLQIETIVLELDHFAKG